MIKRSDYVAMLLRCQKPGTRNAEVGPSVERESDLQDAIEAECKRRGWIAFRSRMDRPTTMPIGTPDFVIMAEYGRTIYVEAKSRKGKVTREQAALHIMAKRLGHEVFVVRSLGEFLEAVTLVKKATQDLYERQVDVANEGL